MDLQCGTNYLNGILDLYNKEKQKNKELKRKYSQLLLEENVIDKDKIKEKIEHYLQQALNIENHTILRDMTENEKQEIKLYKNMAQMLKTIVED